MTTQKLDATTLALPAALPPPQDDALPPRAPAALPGDTFALGSELSSAAYYAAKPTAAGLAISGQAARFAFGLGCGALYSGLQCCAAPIDSLRQGKGVRHAVHTVAAAGLQTTALAAAVPVAATVSAYALVASIVASPSTVGLGLAYGATGAPKHRVGEVLADANNEVVEVIGRLRGSDAPRSLTRS